MQSIVVSDESLNSHGFIVLNSALDLSVFEKNPLMLWKHNRQRLPIGKWKNLQLLNGQWVATPEFDLEDEFAKEIARKYEKGFINASSIGIVPTEKTELNGYPALAKGLLLEISLTDIGSNRNALKLYQPTEGKEGSYTELSFEDFKTLNEKNMTKAEKEKMEALEAQVAKIETLEKSMKNIISLSEENEKKVKELEEKNKALELELKEEKNKTAKKPKEKPEDEGSNDLKKMVLKLSEDLKSIKNERLTTDEIRAIVKQEKQAESEKDTWTLSDWMKKDPQGLKELEKNNAEAFMALHANFRKINNV